MTADTPTPYSGFDTMPISGKWRGGASDAALTDTDPWSGAVLTELPTATTEDLDEAYAAAQAAQHDWADRLPGERATVMRAAADIMDARREEIIDWLVRESGGTLGKCAVEWAVARAGFHEAAALPHHAEGSIVPSDIPGKESRVYRTPVGVIALISPWDFPLFLTNRTLAPALALGNAVVLKPSSDTPVTGGLLHAKILEEAGLPAGVLNVVVGPGAEIGNAMVAHPVPAVVSFTGSTAVGLGITRIAGIKKLCLELGGNGPLIVLDDADLPAAVEAAVFGSFFNSGQICMRANRIIVDASIHDEFVERFLTRVRTLVVGDPSEPGTQIGPVINAGQRDSVLDKVSRAVDAGARLLLGGEPGGPAGLSLPPHVLLGTNDVATAREEVFGPAITIIRARDESDALRIANDTEYGLSSAVFTADGERGARFALQLDAGMTHVNDSPVNAEPNTAYGGEKQSGLGRFGGRWAVNEFTTDHWVSLQHRRREYLL
ncbi:aldehyde dehydrogenase family protein [Nocardia sp. NPDC101769]|uniref:aldehyde dehydrogenase family protein n=1 Tax=Nocardia sp. NPDC101769 TaxID=3364333 RepID=UPI00381C95D9